MADGPDTGIGLVKFLSTFVMLCFVHDNREKFCEIVSITANEKYKNQNHIF